MSFLRWMLLKGEGEGGRGEGGKRFTLVLDMPQTYVKGYNLLHI